MEAPQTGLERELKEGGMIDIENKTDLLEHSIHDAYEVCTFPPVY